MLGYTDDLMVLADEDEDMRWLLRRDLDRKGLLINMEKTKMFTL